MKGRMIPTRINTLRYHALFLKTKTLRLVGTRESRFPTKRFKVWVMAKKIGGYVGHVSRVVSCLVSFSKKILVCGEW